MKHLKQKLMATLAMLLVSSVMLTSASFAWFTISTAPEVQKITTTVTANENLEIALGTTYGVEPVATQLGDNLNKTWGALVTFNPDPAKTGADTATIFTGLGPATISGNALHSAVYGPDGRPETTTVAVVYEKDGDNIKFTDGVAPFKDAEGNVVGQTVLLWVRTNIDGNIVATINDEDITIPEEWKNIIDPSAADTSTKVGKSIVRVAFETPTVGNAGVRATEDANNSRTITLITQDQLTPNTAYPVYMHIYLDGAKMTNALIDVDTKQISIAKIKFTNSKITATDGVYGDSYTNNSSVPTN